MIKWIALIILELANSALIAQEKIANVDDYLYKHIYKNIAAYNIQHLNYQLNGAAKTDIFRDNSDFFYEPFIADPGFKLDMKIEELDSSLPNKNFLLYKIFVGGFDYINKADTATMRYLGKHTLQNFLVGLNPKNGEIKFISGQFFLSAIADEFNIDMKKPESLIPYLAMRSFVVGGKSIVFKKRRHKKLVYEGFSETYKDTFSIIVDKKNMDYTQIIMNIKKKTNDERISQVFKP